MDIVRISARSLTRLKTFVFVGALYKHIKVQQRECALLYTPEHDHEVPGFAARTLAHRALEYPIPKFRQTSLAARASVVKTCSLSAIPFPPIEANNMHSRLEPSRYGRYERVFQFLLASEASRLLTHLREVARAPSTTASTDLLRILFN